MFVSGLVVSVADDESADRVAELVRRDETLALGARVGGRLTVALNAADDRAAEQKHEWLRQLRGVLKVDVAFVFVEEEAPHAR